MIDTIELYILILVLLILSFIQSHRSAREQKFLGQLSHSFFLLKHFFFFRQICLIDLDIAYILDLI